MSALSRRSGWPGPLQAFRKALTSASGSTRGGCSGTMGGCILAMGDCAISPSSRRNLKKERRDRSRLVAVAGLKRLRMSTTNASTCPRRMSGGVGGACHVPPGRWRTAWPPRGGSRPCGERIRRPEMAAEESIEGPMSPTIDAMGSPGPLSRLVERPFPMGETYTLSLRCATRRSTYRKAFPQLRG